MMGVEVQNKPKKTKEPMHQNVDPMGPPSEELKEAIEGKVIKRLGKPPGFYQIEAIHLWDNKWRVNVWIKFYNSTYKVVPGFSITDSFFVEVSKTNRVSASPKIVKKY